MIWIEPAKRERKGNYSIDQYYRDNMKVGGSTAVKSDKPKVVRGPKQVAINDFQFYPPRLADLQNREFDAHRVNLVFSASANNVEGAKLCRSNQRTGRG
jgi:SWI/SNF-related matrix-associated actin-dependent regulator of chromatin subfamily A member 5